MRTLHLGEAGRGPGFRCLMSFRPWQPIFLAALCQTGSVAHAAQAAGVTRQGAYLARSTQNRWGQDRLETLAFAQVWRESLFHAAETVEVELRQRALHGVEREKHFYYKGQCVGVQKYRVYNDSLLALLAKLVLPTYKERETFEFPVTMRPPTLLENQFARLDADDLDELEDLTNLTSDLWGQVLNILDGTPAPDNEDDDDEATEAEGEPDPENDDSEVSSPAESSENTSSNEVNTLSHDSDSKVSSESDLKAPLPVSGRGRGLGLIPAPQVSSQPETTFPAINPPIDPTPIAVDASRLTTDDPQLSSPPTDFPPSGAAPLGAFTYDPEAVYRRWHGLT